MGKRPISQHCQLQRRARCCGSWAQPTDQDDDALWVERIPYPETRFYTKKVLDNLLGYLGGNQLFCKETGAGMGQKRAGDDASDHDHTH